MRHIPINQTEGIRELIDTILISKKTTLEHIAIAVDEEPEELIAIYNEKKKPHKKTIRKLCYLFCDICLEESGY